MFQFKWKKCSFEERYWNNNNIDLLDLARSIDMSLFCILNRAGLFCRKAIGRKNALTVSTFISFLNKKFQNTNAILTNLGFFYEKFTKYLFIVGSHTCTWAENPGGGYGMFFSKNNGLGSMML